MANGIFVGFNGRCCFSEPFQPHAWSSQNFITVDHDIIGQGFWSISSNSAESFPYHNWYRPKCNGTTKQVFSKLVYLSVIVETGNLSSLQVQMYVVGYLVWRAARIISQEQWQSYNPSSIHCI